MEIFAKQGDILETEADLLVVGAYETESLNDPFMERLNELLGSKMTKMAKAQDFEAKMGQTLIFAAPDAMPVEYVMLVGLGPLQESVSDSARGACGIAVQTAKKLGLRSIAIEFIGEDSDEFDAKSSAQAMAESFLLASYEFAVYKKSEGQKVKEVTIVAEDSGDARRATRGIETAKVFVDGTVVARDLVNTPAKDMTPTRLAEAAEEISKMSDGTIEIELLYKDNPEVRKMGAFLAVAQGSEEKPVFIHMTYRPEGTAKKVVSLVGKGVTFDSGGLSLKPGSFMETMKCDMAGSATVLGVFATLGRLKPKVEIHGIIAACENMPSGRAIRPGDIVHSANGKTIEVLNTDAEGRLTLADALDFGQKFEPDYIIDLATLTGSVVVGLGEEVAGIFSNDAKLANDILISASVSSEDIWEMPLHAAYKKFLKSDIADLRNTSTTRYGGAITAALFLSEFIKKDQKWAHIDIAGPAFAERPISSYVGKGGTGFGVRTLAHWLKSM